MRSAQRRGYPGQLRRWRVGWTLTACIAAGIAGLAGLALALLRPSAAGSAPTGPASPAVGPTLSATSPASPPVRICEDKTVLGHGPSSPPRGAIVIRAGDDSGTVLAHNWTIQPHTTYWFAPGRHTLGTGQFSQIIPSDGDTFIEAPGAILDGQHANLYA